MMLVLPPVGNFLKAALSGFVVAAPIGPVALMVFRQTLAADLRLAYATALGSLLVDLLFAFLAFWGLASWGYSLTTNGRLLGSLVIVVLGGLLWFFPPTLQERREKPSQVAWAVFMGMVLTLVNPASILAFAALWEGWGLSWASPLQNFLAILLGTSLWWALMIHLTYRARGWFCMKTVRRVHRTVCFFFVLIGLSTLGLHFIRP